MLKVCDLAKTFDDLRVIESISFALVKNEIVTIMGPSGCGKTTLLRMVAGQEQPDSQRSIYVDVKREEIGFVLQSLHVFPWLTVRGNIEFGLGFHRQDNDGRVEGMLNRLGLADFQDYYPQQLSGGMLQRVALGRSMVLRPRLLLLDEPFTGLDYGRKRELYGLLFDLNERYNVTFLVVGHDVDDAINLSDRIVILSDRPSTVVEIIQNEGRGEVRAKYAVFQRIVGLLRSVQDGEAGADHRARMS